MNFLALIPGKAYVYAGVVLACLAAGWYVSNLQERLVKTEIALEQSQKVIADQQTVIDNIKIDVTKIQTSYADLARLNQANSEALQKSSRVLSTVVANTKNNPLQAATEINILMKERRRCAELASGALPLKQETNSVCPQYLR